MTGLEFDNFDALNKRKYILEENQEFLQWYSKMSKQGFSSIININQMQDLINKITMFYEFKYPNQMFDSLRYKINLEAVEIAKDVSDMLGIEQLKFRLYHDYVQFLECNYGCFLVLKQPINKIWELEMTSVSIAADGSILESDLQRLNEHNFLNDISGISRVEDLFGRFESIDTDVDYSELKRCVAVHKYNVSLKNKILSLIPLAMLYSENTLPDYGYIRAKSFIRTFNKEYNLKMNLEELDKIMSIDYSNSEEVKKLIKKK